ncbi:hypothetical protein ENSA5_06090 [Enhygromyxa salina]|uniref:TSP C-terminal domain-containing protein n=1 Tax=Enhygromyxa salina TaxID=215803 RepID=A0A2S9YHR7_9BACT|nr:hypothetical protein [Enhygromyxa salina]PRQ04653.1 hypothetical protein ENSA5_06090 [Enhygromyxa salina]
MQRNSLQILGFSGLAFSVSLLTACGDPCLDDGRGKPGAVCDPGNADTNTETGTETDTDTDTATATAGDESGTESAEGEPDETWCIDEDSDGFGDPDNCEEIPAGEEPPPGSVPQDQATDCDDADPNTFPGAAELDDPAACMTDADDDGYGDDTPSNANAVPGSDCDDANDHAFPGAAELEDPAACMEDNDEDGWGSTTPSGGEGSSTVPGSDCDDNDAEVKSCPKWCPDEDMDMFLDLSMCAFLLEGEEPPEGYIEAGPDTVGDCDDADPNTYPGAAEIDDPEACMTDADGDGWGDMDPKPGVEPGRDCDDADGARVVCVDAAPGCVDTTDGGSAQLMATASGGDGNYVYAWTPVETLDDPAIPNPTALPTEITTYTVDVTDGEMNMGQDEITVHLTDKPWVLGGVPDAECEAVGFLLDAADHDFANEGTTTCTTSNSDPTAYVCPVVHEQARITGTMTVTDAQGDDDWIGFVWGWQNSSQFYMFHWKQSAQNLGLCVGVEGMVVKKVDALGALSQVDLGCDMDTPNVTVLLGPDETSTEGWIEGRDYGVELLYDLTETEITITDLSDNSVVANFVVMDDSYSSGKFGTYDWSQINACNGPWQSNCL